jgi:hypothetical protein
VKEDNSWEFDSKYEVVCQGVFLIFPIDSNTYCVNPIPSTAEESATRQSIHHNFIGSHPSLVDLCTKGMFLIEPGFNE